MTPLLMIYYVLLMSWLLLLWPALRLKSWMRVFLLIVAGCGLAAAVYEARLWAGTMPSIRLDIPLISFFLGILYSGAAVNLFWAGWRKTAMALGLVAAVIAIVLGQEWMSISRESQRLQEKLSERDSLLFQARFRDQAAYESVFGPFKQAAHPVGHWEARDDWQYARLIINGEGHVWLFYRCGDTECPLVSKEPVLERVEGQVWQATVEQRALQPTTFEIVRAGADRLSIQFERRALDFFEASSPIDPVPAPRSLAYLGAFSAARCQGEHAFVRQLWLWRDGERLYGLGIFAPLVAGHRANFVTPVLLGEGLSRNDRWLFTWEREARAWRAEVTIDGEWVRLTLQRGDETPEEILLEPNALFDDEVIELAPLTSKADWNHWFEIVLTGHFTSGQVPDC